MSRIARAAVLGRPVEHSLSPVLHRAAYAALGLDWSYEAIDCDAGELAAVLAARADWAGFSCTMPLKHAALAVADELRPLAKLVGAANTLLPGEAGGWIAENTDVAGIATALAGRPLGQVIVLGAGGSAQAAVVALGQLGATGCAVLVRDRSRAGALVATAEAAGVQVSLAALAADAPELAAADLVVSTLPSGAADRLAQRDWRPDQALLDVVYDPWPTALAVAVRAAGGVVLSGALMLLHQAAAQLELMTGRAAPVEAMRTALRAAAPGCGV
ncbi:MAG: shikimate dehydrogenase [Pseudonocardiales bacterium]|nr:MAG: shikimate dehydrogenase [Pseudonocardiales bacterium]